MTCAGAFTHPLYCCTCLPDFTQELQDCLRSCRFWLKKQGIASQVPMALMFAPLEALQGSQRLGVGTVIRIAWNVTAKGSRSVNHQVLVWSQAYSTPRFLW